MALVREVLGSTWTNLSPETAIFSLFLLSILLLILCTNCGSHSFDLRRKEDGPESLIRVVRLEDALRENTMINNIRKDEKEFQTENGGPVTVSASIPESSSVPGSDLIPEIQFASGQDNGTWYQPWRSHMGVPEHDGKVNRETPYLELCTPQGHMDSFLPSASPSLFVDPPQVNTNRGTIHQPRPMEEGLDLERIQTKEPGASVEDLHQHIYDVIGGDRKVEAFPVEVILDEVNLVSPGYESIVKIRSNPAKQLDINSDSITSTEDGFTMPVTSTSLMEEVKASLSDKEWNPLYAQVSRRSKCPTPPPVPPPEDEEENEVEESSPPLPDRSAEI
ncbi:uncharacterized protein si:ch73-204p21.2 [Osmerus eperlanus]|uniref:uncharacterized protein si:ch73-204p21.2 n=1 Tax=Osmerus eperlanus TaxID=29151 RepID=UPI002E125BF3